MRPLLTLFPLLLLVTNCTQPEPPKAGTIWLAQNGNRVVTLPGDSEFEVLWYMGSSTLEFFCAAGDYAKMRLHAPSSHRVVLVEPIGPSKARPGTRGVHFVVKSKEEHPNITGGSIGLEDPGTAMTIGSAVAICEPPKRGLGGFF
ncbi:MAG: hypothetical protein ACPGNV_00385 [Mangrovicoccus sp.]